MDQDTWKPCWVRGGPIDEIAWIGKDVLAWCNGLCIVFFDFLQRRQTLRWCASQETGEGARCISAHSILPIFAFAEKTANPRILVFSYPSMTKISECARGSPTGYLATAFTARDYVISAGSYPYFPMTVWSWRTGDKIIAVNSVMRDSVGQVLRVTQLGPMVIGQMGRTCGKLFTWELSVAGKVVILKDYEVKLPRDEPIRGIDWCPTTEPLLAITDENGHIFLSNFDGSNVYRIVLSQRCGICPDIEVPMVCWFRGGIVLRTTFCQLRYYRKNPRTDVWHKVWYIKSVTKPGVMATHPFKNERVFYHTFEGQLMQIDFPGDERTPNVQMVLQYGAVYRFVDFVYPWCHHLIVTDDLKELAVLECYSGMEVSRLDPEVHGEISCQASHPDYPMIGLVTLQGELVVVSVVDPEEPRILARVRLQRRPLDLIKFSYSGRFLIAAEKKTGNCYCVNVHRDKAVTVQVLLETHHRLTDVLLQEVRGNLKLLVLMVGARQFSVGQQLLVYDIPNNQNLISHSTDVLDLPGVYRSLWHVPGNPNVLVGSPYLTRQLRVQRLQDFKNVIVLDGLASGHQMKLANLFVDRHWITSAAFDGLIFVRDKSVRRVAATFMVHHRHDFGTVKAMANRAGDMIVSVGYDGSLVAMRAPYERRDTVTSLSVPTTENVHNVDHDWYERQKERILVDYTGLDPSVHNLLTRSTRVSLPKEEDKTWEEWRAEMQVQDESKLCAREKTALLADFEVLKKKVEKLLNANETSPEIERLPVSSFDLDMALRDHKLKAARDEREDVRKELEHNSNQMQRVSEWLRATFWNPQKVVGKSLYSIFDTKEVTNYPLVLEEPGFKDQLQWSQFCQESMRRIIESDTFQPWRQYTEEELQVELAKGLKLYREDEKRRIDMLLEEEEVEVDEGDVEEQRAVSGITTHRFVEESSYYYSQMESYGFTHVVLNNCFLRQDCGKLRSYFNKIFDEVYAAKEREMSVIRERIERIRYINSELRSMFGQSVQQVPADPEWHWQERPEGVIKVFDREVKARPYVSASQQEILDKQAAEAERIRQLLLADDFRERALMAMMDGVLEVRWEDVIKINVPKPRCMIDKKPEAYTAEDILAVNRYEKDVQALQEERERYKRILESDYLKVASLLEEGIGKFNSRLGELFQLKINIEKAINQLNLRYVRGTSRNYRRVKALEAEDQLKAKIAEKLRYETILSDQLQLYENVLQECFTRYEEFSVRDKGIAKKFRADFSSLGKTNLELLQAQYHRRPRTSLRNAGVLDLVDLGNHVLQQAQSVYLLPECREYLRMLEALDVRPTALPASVDASNWERFVRHRRQKIDLELKIRAKQADISDTEHVIAHFEGKVGRCKSDVREMRKKLQEMRSDRVTFEQDLAVQLVLKMGQVEIRLRGVPTDTADAIFVSRTEIEGVNRLIRAAGSCKLEALTRALNFQRGTLLKEWAHECLKKRLEDLREDLRFTRSVTVTKEMQEYLKRQARGLKEDKTPAHLERETEAMRARYQQLVANHAARLEGIEKEIAITRSKNELLDRQIMKMNVARCEMEQKRDLIGEAKQREYMERKMRLVMRRSDLIKKLQDNYAELLALQTEHELLRLRRYPMLQFKTLDDQPNKKNVS